jgi:hypothetical protein
MPSPGDDSYGKRQVRHRACDHFMIPLELPHRRLLSLDGRECSTSPPDPWITSRRAIYLSRSLFSVNNVTPRPRFSRHATSRKRPLTNFVFTQFRAAVDRYTRALSIFGS